MLQPSWADIGSLQSDVSQLKQQLRNKVDSHELHTLDSKVDSLERALRETNFALDELRYRVEDAENKIEQGEEVK